MRRLTLVLLLTFLVLVSMAGCIKPEESPIYTEFEENIPELTMAVFLYEPAHLVRASQIYENETGIRVNIQNNYIKLDYEAILENFDPLDNYPNNGAFIEQALSSLMTGSGADIYDVRFLDFGRLGKNGLLVDMSDLLDNDANLTNDIVFRDILLGDKTEDGIFAIPIDFAMSTLRTAAEDVPPLENKRRTWKEFFDEIGELELSQERAYASHDLSIFMDRFISRASYFIDEAGNSNNLDSGEMVSLLEECRAWAEMGLCADARDLEAYMNGSYAYSGNSVSYYYTLAEGLCTLPEEYSRVSDGYFPGGNFAPMPFDGDPVIVDGDARYPEIGTYTGRYGVNAGSSNTEAAQDFLMFLLSPEIQEEMVYKPMLDPKSIFNGFFLPVNRAAFRGMAERDLERVRTWNRELVMDIPALIKEAEGRVDQVAYIITEKPYYRTIIFEPARDYFTGQISAEEAARQMSDKVGLYLKELG